MMILAAIRITHHGIGGLYFCRLRRKPKSLHSVIQKRPFLGFLRGRPPSELTSTAKDFAEPSRTKLNMPVLAIAGDKSMAEVLGQQMELMASDVTVVVLKDAGTGCWRRVPRRRPMLWLAFCEMCLAALPDMAYPPGATLGILAHGS